MASKRCTRSIAAQAGREPERGSALLIVFLFAAFIAIMLYKVLPDAYFEAQRQKEQLLIDRGTQYKTAIKRFVTKNQAYPTSIDQLDNFNGARYLRRHYKDPMTGKDEWRLIHIMSPGGVLTDSKVTPFNAQNNANGQQNNSTQGGGFGTPSSNSNSNSSFGSNSNSGGFGSNSSSGFGSNSNSSGFGSNSNSGGFGSNSNSGGFGSNSGGFGSGGFGSNEEQNDPNAPPEPTAAQRYGALRRPQTRPAPKMDEDGNLVPPEQGDPEDATQGELAANGVMGTSTPPTAASNGIGMAPNAQAAAAAASGQDPNAVAAAANGASPSATPVRPGTGPGGQVDPVTAAANGISPDGTSLKGNNANGQNTSPVSGALSTVNDALRKASPTPITAAQVNKSSGPVIANGSIAGVASKAQGSSIKVMDKQTDYSKWEFVYNPQQEAANQMQKATGGNNQQQNGQKQSNTSSQSSFGQDSFGVSDSSTTGTPRTGSPANSRSSSQWFTNTGSASGSTSSPNQ